MCIVDGNYRVKIYTFIRLFLAIKIFFSGSETVRERRSLNKAYKAPSF
jgi:hypothetical protein